MYSDIETSRELRVHYHVRTYLDIGLWLDMLLWCSNASKNGQINRFPPIDYYQTTLIAYRQKSAGNIG